MIFRILSVLCTKNNNEHEVSEMHTLFVRLRILQHTLATYRTQISNLGRIVLVHTPTTTLHCRHGSHDLSISYYLVAKLLDVGDGCWYVFELNRKSTYLFM